MAKKKMVAVPANCDEAAEFIRRIAEIERERAKIENALTQKVENLKEEAAAKVKPLDQEFDEALVGLYIFAEVNRRELTKDDTVKTVKLLTGEFSWRTGPWAITFTPGVKKEVIVSDLLKADLPQFVRYPEPEPDKEEMRKTPESRALAAQVPNVQVGQGEFFNVKPSATDVGEIERSLKVLRGKLPKPRKTA